MLSPLPGLLVVLPLLISHHKLSSWCSHGVLPVALHFARTRAGAAEGGWGPGGNMQGDASMGGRSN